MGYYLSLVLLLVLNIWQVPGFANEVAITEWPVPWKDSRPRDPFVDIQGQVWFVGQRGDYIAVLQPDNGNFKKYPLDQGTGPHNLIVAKDGSVWYAGNLATHIGKLNPQSGVIQKYVLPESNARDPHTLVFDQQQQIWFTVQMSNFVGKLAPRSGEIILLPVPTPGARPYGIVIDHQNRPWFTEFGSHKLGWIDPENMRIQEVPLSREKARPRRLAAASDGSIWYVDYAQGYLGKLNPTSGQIQEWSVPGGKKAHPYGMAIDDEDRLWFVETGHLPNHLVGFDPTTENFFSVTDIPSGGGTVRHMYFHKPSRTLWFGTDTNTLGRAQIP
ncbi:lyase [Nitrosococcus wardiae]|uniref:Lyase n=1 Tax=Nitrosococcus wardiae TaxID=1814290 RepID=A0A4P7BYW2_9GAMM|nr:lyase [Nitrosococcus wardiae]QBQ55383.1 lyase [Nitrosococcus wardiae]